MASVTASFIVAAFTYCINPFILGSFLAYLGPFTTSYLGPFLAAAFPFVAVTASRINQRPFIHHLDPFPFLLILVLEQALTFVA